MMYKLKIYTSLVILSSYVDWFCFVFLFDTDNIETGSSYIISHGTTTVLFISLTDIEIRRFTRKKQEFGLKYSNGNTVDNINTIQVQIEQQLSLASIWDLSDRIDHLLHGSLHLWDSFLIQLQQELCL